MVTQLKALGRIKLALHTDNMKASCVYTEDRPLVVQ